MPDDPNQALARAAARIQELVGQVADRDRQITDLLTRATTAENQLSVAQAGSQKAVSLQAELDALRALTMTDPPVGTGIVKVNRYMTSDGSKHKTLPAAMRWTDVHALMDRFGYDRTGAERIVDAGAASALLGPRPTTPTE